MNFESFIMHLKAALLQPLPGEEAQLKMAPQSRLRYNDYRVSYANARQSAVLIAVYQKNNAPHTILILRAEKQGVHSGQVSFPGGSYEAHDFTIEETALREAEEELGIEREKVKILGKLTPLIIPASNFHVQPFLGLLPEVPSLRLNDAEVMGVVEVELFKLTSSLIKSRGSFAGRNGGMLDAPFYDIAGNKVWGATAMILSELEEMIRSFEPNAD
jgi:8-oxo-dGTP pyrophosphatase MutT (NUDIX family)